MFELHTDRHIHDIIKHRCIERHGHWEVRTVEHFVRHKEFEETDMFHIKILPEMHQERYWDNDVGKHVIMFHDIPESHFHVIKNTAVKL